MFAATNQSSRRVWSSDSPPAGVWPATYFLFYSIDWFKTISCIEFRKMNVAILPPLPRIAGAFRVPTLFDFVASDLGERGNAVKDSSSIASSEVLRSDSLPRSGFIPKPRVAGARA